MISYYAYRNFKEQVAGKHQAIVFVFDNDIKKRMLSVGLFSSRMILCPECRQLVPGKPFEENVYAGMTFFFFHFP